MIRQDTKGEAGECPLDFAARSPESAFQKSFAVAAPPTCSARQEAGTRCLNAPRHPTPSSRAAQPLPRRTGCHRRSTPGLLATGWWVATQRQSLISRTMTSQASTCDASEAAGLTSEDRRSTTAAPTSTGCRSRSTVPCYVEDSRPEASANSASSFETPRKRRIKLRAAYCLGQPRPASASLGQSAGMFWLAGHTPRCLPHRSPRHRQARDHKDDPHLSFADDPLPCRQERVPEPQGQEPPGLEAVARLICPFFAHAGQARRQCTGRHRLGLWVCGVRRSRRVEPQPVEITASHGFVRIHLRTRGGECGQRMRR